MASVKNLKKDINYVLGDIIDAVYQWEAETGNINSKEGSELIDKAIATFDNLLEKVHQKDVENKKVHYKEIRNQLEKEATDLISSLNDLATS
ncbi:hypothetical protein [Flavobacterium sp. ASW18X]|uniref:hypothetical protein n=1 Tax=Flavobacterium sp. ASW18X TaxID=2572595 RepID=UPI0010ADB242|nr:hypothetical protein [Flavobacterium sp. ASW18X]TKD55697.1 hypothetical protein FBT53_15745 [Flavobacterium sp. ASW18X]